MGFLAETIGIDEFALPSSHVFHAQIPIATALCSISALHRIGIPR